MLVNSDKFEESLVEKKKLITKARKFLELMENINWDKILAFHNVYQYIMYMWGLVALDFNLQTVDFCHWQVLEKHKYL
jgi:hypothetical protein